jgi:hypothetical protein
MGPAQYEGQKCCYPVNFVGTIFVYKAKFCKIHIISNDSMIYCKILSHNLHRETEENIQDLTATEREEKMKDKAKKKQKYDKVKDRTGN